MKNIFFTVTIIFTVALKINSQWFIQHAEPEGYFIDINCTSVDTGWVAGLWEMLRTTNGGNNWDTLIQRPQSNTVIQAISFIDNELGWYVEQNGDENHCNIYKTMNGGNDWFLQYTSPQYTLIWDMQFINQNVGYCVGSDPTFPVLWKTIDGGDTWNTIIIDNIYAPILRTLFFIDSLEGWAAGDGIYKTTNGGSTWNMLVGPYWEYVFNIQFTTSNIGWYSDLFGIKKTTDGGSSWIQQASGGDGWHTSSLYFIDSDTGYFCPFNSVLKTTNGGSSWDVQFIGNSLNLSGVCFVNPSNGWIIGYNPGRIFHTDNGGLPVELTSFTASVSVNDVHLNWSTATELNNSGFEIERTSPLPPPYKGGGGEAGGAWEKIGYISGHGTTTEQQHYSFVDESVSSGKYQYRLKQIDYDGTFEYSDIVEVEVGLPTEFSLEQNYPNPFNPKTKIKFTIPTSPQSPPYQGGEAEQGLSVQLKVYDVLGNEVATLLNEVKPAGSYDVNFDAKGLTSGIYFYQLRVDNFSTIRKMILLR